LNKKRGRNLLTINRITNTHLAEVYGNDKGFRIKKVVHPDERKIRKKMIKQFTNLRKGY